MKVSSYDLWRLLYAVAAFSLLALAWTESPCERPDGSLKQQCEETP